jgi:hypothetical protein
MLTFALAACNRDEPAVYHVEKDDASPPQTQSSAPPDAAQPPMAPPASASTPSIKYQLPTGWQEKPPSEMRVASFDAPGSPGKSADVSIIPLSVIGRDLDLVNMWRSRMELPPTYDPNAASQAVPVSIGDETGRLFEFASEPANGKPRQRLIVAMLTRGTMSWFFKITGDDETVTAQKANFLQFLKSVSFQADAAAPAPGPADNQR